MDKNNIILKKVLKEFQIRGELKVSYGMVSQTFYDSKKLESFITEELSKGKKISLSVNSLGGSFIDILSPSVDFEKAIKDFGTNS